MPARLRLLVSDASAPVAAQRKQLATVLAHVTAARRHELLSDLLAHLAPMRLEWCYRFLQEEAQAPRVRTPLPSSKVWQFIV